MSWFASMMLLAVTTVGYRALNDDNDTKYFLQRTVWSIAFPKPHRSMTFIRTASTDFHHCPRRAHRQSPASGIG
jgi:hypothetical protein